MIEALSFYLFSAVLLISAGMVVTARNPVHAVLFLILSFFNAAALFVMLGAEFLAMTLVVVYVGAVAVLFLFVVMMLDIDFERVKSGARRHRALGLAVAGVLAAELVWLFSAWTSPAAQAATGPVAASNTSALGRVLYTVYVYPFQISGLILLVAMIGAIALTHRGSRSGTLRQNIARQVARDPKDVVKLEKINSGAGVV